MDQIQRISMNLRQYGKIEGKNVFYWFQNHKVRKRQKKRNTPDNQLIALACGPTNLHQQQPATRSNNLSNIINKSTVSLHDTKSPISCVVTSHAGLLAGTSFPAGLVGVGQIGSYGYGPKTKKRRFWEGSISSQANSTIDGSRSQNYDLFIPVYDFYQLLRIFGEEEGKLGCQVGTLPLFPMHDEDSSNNKGPWSNNNHSSYYFGNNVGDTYTSLELSLNSLVGHSHDPL